MSRRLIAACALAALLACGPHAAAQPEPERHYGRVQGKVLNRRGEVVAGAVISVEGAGGVVRDIGYTEEGEYNLDLPPGVYHVTVSSVGYYPLRRQRVRFRAGRTVTINFTLEAPRGRARARRGA